MANSPDYDIASLVGRAATAEQVRRILADLQARLRALDERAFTTTKIQEAIHAIAESRNLDSGQIRRPLDVIFAWQADSHGLLERMAILGRTQVLDHLSIALRSLTDRA